MSDDSLDKYIELRPKVFNSEIILVYLNTLDKNFAKAEREYDEVKDQVDELFDFLHNEKIENGKLSVSQAKLKVRSDERYIKVRAEYRKRKW